MNSLEIESLAKFLSVDTIFDYKKAITRWVELNNPKPTKSVVGLSDSQIIDLENAIWQRKGTITILECIKSYLNLQKFDDVVEKEVAVGLTNEQVHRLARFLDGDINSNITKIKKWLVNNRDDFVKPTTVEVAVGLNEDQINKMVYHFTENKHFHSVEDIKEFLNYQSFTKYEKFIPDWNTAPPKAEEMCVVVHWADRNSNILKTEILFQEENPNTTCNIEIGSLWSKSSAHLESKSNYVIVIGLGKERDDALVKKTVAIQWKKDNTIEVLREEYFIKNFDMKK
jgi:hypothetical protein